MNATRPVIVLALLLGLSGCATTDFVSEQYHHRRDEPMRGDVVIVTLMSGEQLRTAFEARDGDTLQTGDGRIPLDEVSSVTVDPHSFRSRAERVGRVVVASAAWSVMFVLYLLMATL